MTIRDTKTTPRAQDKLDREIRWRMHGEIFENPEEIEELIPLMRGLDKDIVRQYARELAILLRQRAMCGNGGVRGKTGG
jgi:hypothetical protein